MIKIFIELFETESKKGFHGKKDGKFYYLFPSQDVSRGIVYRMLQFNDEETFNQRLNGERVDADRIVGIKEMHSDKGLWYSGMLFNNEEKQAFYVNLYDNTTPSPDKPYQKMVVLKEAEYREREEKPNPIDGREVE